MEKLPGIPPFQGMLSFAVTLRCNLRCKHCIMSADAQGLDMDPVVLRGWLEEAAQIKRIKAVCFTGGEPFLVYNTLKEASSLAHDLGFKVSMVTNGYWATSMPRAMELLKGLSHLDLMTISFDRYHLEFLSLETLKTAIRAGQEAGIHTDIRVSFLDDEEKDMDEAARLLEGALDREKITAQPIMRAGRAASELDREKFHSFELDIPCVNASRPLVHPDGAMHVCCGPAYTLPYDNPLWLGNARQTSLTQVAEEAQYNLALQIIRSQGPYHLWKMVRGDDLEDLKRYDTTNLCSFCMSIMSDTGFLQDLKVFLEDPKLLKKIAIERFFLLQEPEMLLGLKNRDVAFSKQPSSVV